MTAPRDIAPGVDPLVADAVRRGLASTPKSLPAWLFYDDEGSRLFEAITELPEYYPTRTERAILAAHADDIIEAAGTPAELVELGSGSARKTAILLEAAQARRPDVVFRPIDVSAAALDAASRQLADALPSLRVEPVEGRFRPALASLPQAAGSRLVLFMGSNLGNFTPEQALEFLRDVAGALGRDDRLLLGVDLEKDPVIVLPAYDDAQGVTAAFDRNVLARLDRELGADFDAATFRHVALWNPAEHRIEMHLESDRARVVHVRALGIEVRLAAGERIHTENSYKLPPAELDALLARAGLATVREWRDAREWFSVRLVASR